MKELNLVQNSEVENVSFLLRDQARMEDAVFVYCGKAAIPAFSVDPVGRTLGQMIPKAIFQQVKAASDRARKEGRAITCDGDYRGEDGAEMRFRSVFMPARSAQDVPARAEYILGTFGQREFSAQAA